jgi:hypothetical protein
VRIVCVYAVQSYGIESGTFGKRWEPAVMAYRLMLGAWASWRHKASREIFFVWSLLLSGTRLVVG